MHYLTTVHTSTHDETCCHDLNTEKDEVASKEISPVMLPEVAGDLIGTKCISSASDMAMGDVLESQESAAATMLKARLPKNLE